jgi:hypothetical protein
MTITTPRYLTTEQAAAALQVSPAALRERVRRAQQRVQGRVVADLGVAYAVKFGATWRFEIRPDPSGAR